MTDDVIDGSIVGWCEVCAEEVWIAPSGQRIIDKQQARVICTQCGVELIRLDPDARLERPSGEQIEELRRHVT